MSASRLLGVAALAAAALALAACDAPGEAAAPTPSATATAASPTPAPTPRVSVPVSPATPPPATDVPSPTALSIPDLGVDMPVEPVGVQADGSMEIPADPAVAGWYRFGKAPAEGAGATVIAAHVDSRRFGIGPLAALRDAQPGQTAVVADQSGARQEYLVRSVTYLPRAELPVDDLFAREGPRMLVVITCGGTFDEQTRTYSDNVVMIAEAVA
jgi:hypothetical protein